MAAPAETPSRAARIRPWLLLTAILASALGLRSLSLSREAVWFDEVMVLLPIDSPNVVEYLHRMLPRTPVPPGFMITEYFWSRIAGTSVMALRAWPVICGVTGLAALFMLTRRLLSERTALIAALWVSFLGWHIYYSQEIRYYPLSLLFSLLSMWSFVEFAAAPSARRLALHGLVNGCMVWTHPLTAFLSVAQFVFLLLFRRRHARFVAAWWGVHALLALSLVAFVASLDRRTASALTGWIPVPTLWGSPPSVYEFVAGSSGASLIGPVSAAGHALRRLQPWYRAALIVFASAATVLGARVLFRGPRAPGKELPLPPREIVALLLLWLVLPPFLLYTISHLWRPMFIVRYVLFATFPIYILLAHYLAARPRVMIAAAFTLLAGYDAIYYFPGPFRSPFDRLTAKIQAESAMPSTIYVDDMLAAPPIEYYWRGGKPTIDNPLEMADVTSGGGNSPKDRDVWLVYTDRQRFERAQRRLAKAKVESREFVFDAAFPLWLVHLGP